MPEVGKMAINDGWTPLLGTLFVTYKITERQWAGLILETCIYLLLGKHLKAHPAYHRLVHLFHEVLVSPCIAEHQQRT